jgi:hypothetical protein
VTTRLGAYSVEAEIGRGGMGRVYRARHVPTGAYRAIKMLDGSPGPEEVERFRREAAGLARLQPGDAVAIHETGSDGGRLYFVMDLMPGGSLRDRLRREGALPWAVAARLVARLARAMGRAHVLGLVHRDLKPENILFDDRGEPRIADWGCVRDLGAATLTATGTALGTPRYMAPEQLDGKRVGVAADVYALGVILHEAVTGAPPYTGKGWVQVMTSIRAGGRDRAARLAGVPAGLDVVLDRALAFDPAGRHGSATALAAELEALGTGKGPAPPARRSAVLAVVAGLVAAASGLLAFGGRASVRSPPLPPVPVAPRAAGKSAGRSGQVEAAIVGAAPITSAELALVAQVFPEREASISLLVFAHPAKLVEPLRSARLETPALGRLFFVAAVGAGRIDLRSEALQAWKAAGGRADPGKLLANAIVSVDALASVLSGLPPEAAGDAGDLEAHGVLDALQILSVGGSGLATPEALSVILEPLRAIARTALRDHLLQAGTPREIRLRDVGAAIANLTPAQRPAVLDAVDTIRLRPHEQPATLAVALPRAVSVALRLDDEPEVFSAVVCWIAEADTYSWQSRHVADPSLLEAALREVDRRATGRSPDPDPGWSAFMERERHHARAKAEVALASCRPGDRADHFRRAEAEAREALAVTESVREQLASVPQRAREDARYVVEILIAAGRVDAVDAALRSKLFGDDPLMAELIRVNDKDPEKAFAYARGLLATKIEGTDARHAHAVCALASADLGDFVTARRELDEVRAMQSSLDADGLGAPSVEVYILRKEQEKTNAGK